MDWLLVGEKDQNFISQKKISESIAGVNQGNANMNNVSAEDFALLERKNKFLEDVIEQKNSIIRQYEKLYGNKD